ncbi:MAG: diguanylate cyclase (GGDEF)-like protein [Candidatus Azotimanducaceae bacterium]|jgi:diguanylate cyclase (GGDEF)-like protein
MAQPTNLHSVRKNRAQVIAHDPRRVENIISNRRDIRVLELSDLLSRSLELEKIVETFSNEIKNEVPHVGFHYDFSEIGTSFSQGDEAVYSANYRLSVQNVSIGELTFFRDRSFSSEEICDLEDLLCALVYPVKHAVMYRTLLKSAYSDPLTGLNNRTSMEKCLPREVDLAKRHQQSMAILVMDLDGFKEINDNHGHDIGDQMLREVGQVIHKAVRNTDLLYRYGGDEFVGGLVQTDLEGAIYVSERIRSGVENLPSLTDLPSCRIKISIGLTMVKFSDSFDQAFKRADKALYSAKLAGKNQISVL